MSPLVPASSASSRRIGSARALIASVRALSPLSSRVSTRVSSPPVSVTRSWMIEKGVVAVSVADRTGPFLVGRLLLTRRTAGSTAAPIVGWRPAPAGAAIDGGRARALASSAAPPAPARGGGGGAPAAERPLPHPNPPPPRGRGGAP